MSVQHCRQRLQALVQLGKTFLKFLTFIFNTKIHLRYTSWIKFTIKFT